VLAFFKRLVLYPINYLSIRRVAGLAVNSEAVARSFADHLRIPLDRFVTVAPGLPDSAFGPALDPERARALRSELGLREGHPVLLNVGMLIPLKGQLQLIEMLELLADDLPDAQLLLVGDGPDRPMLEARILASAVGDRVHLLGHRQDVPELLRISDALLSASRSEGFGLSLLEAMAASLPVIGVRTPAFLEFLDEGITAELVDAQDAAQLADAVRRVFSDPTRAAEMGARGRQRALEYRTSVRAEALGDFLQNALRPGASGR
jgi:glycosyltransferase involved in cell wall biosynthesis